MNARAIWIGLAAASMAFTTNGMAHPGGGVGAGLGMAGPPPSVTMGPPAAAMSHIPNGVSFGHAMVPDGVAAKASDHIGAEVNEPPTAGLSNTVDTDPAIANAAAELGKLNAAHASPTALEHASPNSVVGAISTYKSATVTAEAAVNKDTSLVSQDNAAVAADQTALTSAQNALIALQSSGTATPQQLAAAQTAVASAQTAVATASAQLSADQASLASAQGAIVSAQNTLASATNKTLTPEVIAQLNALLGI